MKRKKTFCFVLCLIKFQAAKIKGARGKVGHILQGQNQEGGGEKRAFFAIIY